jgi:IclR family transcriptional regulator, KDG regulon repressor
MPIVETQSLHRAVAILDCFHLDQTELGVREIARQVNLHPSTVGRLLTTLTTLGLVKQDEKTHRYRMGSKVLRWSSIYMSRLDLRNETRPYMEEIHFKTQETVSLYIPDGDSRVCIERLESPQSVRLVAHIGERMPLYAGASGKVLLAFIHPEQQEKIIQDVPLQKLTERTIVNRDDLRHELADIRDKGYAISLAERVEGAASVAAPIFDLSGKAIGAINISGPSGRFSEDKIQEYAHLLVEVTQQISRAMGYFSNEIV